MNKITSKEDITFRVNGTTVLEITSKGCLADEESTEIARERLGGNIEITSISANDAVKEAKAKATKEAKEAKGDNAG